jgi:arginine/ornithine transport system permease protein
VIRGTPLLVQLFIIYYGLPQFEPLRDSALWPLFRSPWFCAWLAFTLNTTAYTTEMFAGAIRATPAGEIEAARAMGLSDVPGASATCSGRARGAARCRNTATRSCR